MSVIVVYPHSKWKQGSIGGNCLTNTQDQFKWQTLLCVVHMSWVSLHYNQKKVTHILHSAVKHFEAEFSRLLYCKGKDWNSWHLQPLQSSRGLSLSNKGCPIQSHSPLFLLQGHGASEHCCLWQSDRLLYCGMLLSANFYFDSSIECRWVWNTTHPQDVTLLSHPASFPTYTAVNTARELMIIYLQVLETACLN